LGLKTSAIAKAGGRTGAAKARRPLPQSPRFGRWEPRDGRAMGAMGAARRPASACCIGTARLCSPDTRPRLGPSPRARAVDRLFGEAPRARKGTARGGWASCRVLPLYCKIPLQYCKTSSLTEPLARGTARARAGDHQQPAVLRLARKSPAANPTPCCPMLQGRLPQPGTSAEPPMPPACHPPRSPGRPRQDGRRCTCAASRCAPRRDHTTNQHPCPEAHSHRFGGPLPSHS
jgi:hypothetical protein